jgi:hypothetical protein
MLTELVASVVVQDSYMYSRKSSSSMSYYSRRQRYFSSVNTSLVIMLVGWHQVLSVSNLFTSDIVVPHASLYHQFPFRKALLAVLQKLVSLACHNMSDKDTSHPFEIVPSVSSLDCSKSRLDQACSRATL